MAKEEVKKKLTEVAQKTTNPALKKAMEDRLRTIDKPIRK